MKLYSTAAKTIIIIIIIIILESTTSKNYRKQPHEMLRTYSESADVRKKGQNVYCGI
jgi:hypothetical protein